MELYHIVATSGGGVIGKGNKLPWHSSADLKHFKALTMGSTVIMGRKTFESIGKPLPGRENFVLTHSKNPNRGNIKFFDSLENALENISTPKAFIIGGEDVFKQTLDKVAGVWLTKVQGQYQGDAYYPEIPANIFEIKSREKSQDDPRLEFIYYERKRKE